MRMVRLKRMMVLITTMVMGRCSIDMVVMMKTEAGGTFMWMVR